MSSGRNGVLAGIFAIALALLLYLRVDWWWWGKDMPLIYHRDKDGFYIGIWAGGTI